MGYLTINTRSNRVVIIINKDTRDYYIVYYVHVPVNHVRYLLLLLIIYRSLIYFVHCSIFISFFVRLFFLIHCSKETDSILILDCISGISIPLDVKCCTRIPSPSMQVNKHHTSDCTDFVLV
jgi:hypothetical protein